MPFSVASDYLRTIEYQDALRGELLASLQSLGLGERTAVVISADHGFTQVADVASSVLRLLGLPGVKLKPDGRVREEVLAR